MIAYTDDSFKQIEALFSFDLDVLFTACFDIQKAVVSQYTFLIIIQTYNSPFNRLRFLFFISFFIFLDEQRNIIRGKI